MIRFANTLILFAVAMPILLISYVAFALVVAPCAIAYTLSAEGRRQAKLRAEQYAQHPELYSDWQ